jgi:hypothetical protein
MFFPRLLCGRLRDCAAGSCDELGFGGISVRKRIIRVFEVNLFAIATT